MVVGGIYHHSSVYFRMDVFTTILGIDPRSTRSKNVGNVGVNTVCVNFSLFPRQ